MSHRHQSLALADSLVVAVAVAADIAFDVDDIVVVVGNDGGQD